jgi:hypothetical protein
MNEHFKLLSLVPMRFTLIMRISSLCSCLSVQKVSVNSQRQAISKFTIENRCRINKFYTACRFDSIFHNLRDVFLSPRLGFCFPAQCENFSRSRFAFPTEFFSCCSLLVAEAFFRWQRLHDLWTQISKDIIENFRCSGLSPRKLLCC